MAIIVSASLGYVRRETSDFSNAEIRMTNLETMTNYKSRTLVACVFVIRVFVLPSSWVLRASSLAKTWYWAKILHLAS